MPKPPSKRAERVWQRLGEWYGTRLVEQYGEDPPPDWCEIVDEIDNEQIKRGLAILRQRYVQHPPTLPQFEAVMRPPRAPEGPNVAERLCAYAVKTFGASFSERQMRGPWTYVHDAEGRISGVVIDPDGVLAGYRINVADIGLPNWLDAGAAFAGRRLVAPRTDAAASADG